jgi:4-amino-4-deoxy-L-arabinose transferase-like glycosyltransferase
MPVLDRDEGRFTEASSEMMETGDYVVIRYHEDLRNKKPVAIHWLQSAAVNVT